ncbi:MAG: DUF2892 domain-containing protein [Clostridiales bacterium]
MKNVGTLDRIVRFILGLILFYLFFVIESNFKFIGLLGIVLILTSLFSFCGLYKIFGINTCKIKTPNK